MAPEQVLNGPSGAATDLYAFGLVIYYALAGVPPFRGGQQDVLVAQVKTTPPPLASRYGCAAVDAFIDKALSKWPSQRFRRAGELHEALAQALSQSKAAKSGR